MSSPGHHLQNTIDRTSWLVRGAPGGQAAVRQLLRLALFGAMIIAVLSLVIYLTWESDALTLKPGQIANRTIKAPRTATFVSELKTEKLRQEAYDDARNIVLRPDPSVAPTQLSLLRNTLSEIEAIRSDRSLSRDQAIERIRAVMEGLSTEDAAAIVTLEEPSWNRVRDESVRTLTTVLGSQIRAEDVAQVKDRLFEETSLALPNQERSLAAALARPLVQANVQIDEQETRKAREAAADAVEPVMVTVQQSQAIVRDGDPVTAEDIEKLEYFQLLTPSQNWPQFAGLVGLVAFVTCSLMFYLYKFSNAICRSRQLVLVGLVVLAPVIAARLVLPSPDVRYMFPAAAAAMLLAILLDFQIAVVVGSFIALFIGIVSGATFEIAFISLLSSLAGAALIWRAERTVTFLWAGAAVAATTAVSGLLFMLMNGSVTPMLAGAIVVHAGINGALSASLTFLLFSLLGRLFGITTHLQLLELAHPTQPLLYRLAREAAGTYHHSILVSNLAESAIELVGGDPLFARVAVLYHDIGKVLRPSFFVENQANRANVHDALDPHTSARIIQEHVHDGVRLAQKARLPKPIIDVIQQHHGTSLIRYFYTQALNSGEDVDEAEFRYQGPRPQTKEAGVVMLADSVEAAVRSAAQSGKLYANGKDGNGGQTSKKLEEIVESIIRQHLEDGQLDDCDLTLKQIQQIRQTFATILEGIYHPRVEYPEPTSPPSSPQATPEAVEVT